MQHMRTHMPTFLCLIIVAVVTTTIACGKTETPSTQTLKYPATTKGPIVDDYAGVKVPDPYRWMEALDSKEVADWIAAQNAVTDPYLRSLPLREPLNTRLTELWNYPRVGVPTIEHGTLFYARNTGLLRQ